MPRTRSILVLSLLALAALAGRPAAAQPVELDPRVAIEEATAAYRRGPVADEVTATLRIEASAGRRPAQAQQRFIIRVDAGDPEGQSPPRARIELGDLTVYLEDGRLMATSEWGPAKILVQDFPSFPGPSQLTAALPPLPLPQLALAADDDFSSPTPYTPGVAWTRASADPQAPLALVLLEGQGPHGPVAALTDAETGRLLRLTATISATPPAILDLLFEPIDPGDPSSWAIDPTGREIVESAQQLVGVRENVPLPSPEPPVVLRDGDGEIWQPADPAESARPLALVVVRASDDQFRTIRTAASALSAINGEGRAIGPHARAVVQFQPGGFSATRFADLGRAWSDELRRRAREGRELLWTDDALAPDAHGDAAVVLIAPDGLRRGTVPVRMDDAPERIAAEIARLLEDAAPAPPGGG